MMAGREHQEAGRSGPELTSCASQATICGLNSYADVISVYLPHLVFVATPMASECCR